MGIEEVLIAARSPWQNGTAERWVGSARRELPDHMIVFDEQHQRRLLRDYVDYYSLTLSGAALGGSVEVVSSRVTITVTTTAGEPAGGPSADGSAGTTKSAPTRRSTTEARSSSGLRNSTKWLDLRGSVQDGVYAPLTVLAHLGLVDLNQFSGCLSSVYLRISRVQAVLLSGSVCVGPPPI
jgi:hypothetical protein